MKFCPKSFSVLSRNLSSEFLSPTFFVLSSPSDALNLTSMSRSVWMTSLTSKVDTALFSPLIWLWSQFFWHFVFVMSFRKFSSTSDSLLWEKRFFRERNDNFRFLKSNLINNTKSLIKSRLTYQHLVLTLRVSSFLGAFYVKFGFLPSFFLVFSLSFNHRILPRSPWKKRLNY